MNLEKILQTKPTSLYLIEKVLKLFPFLEVYIKNLNSVKKENEKIIKEIENQLSQTKDLKSFKKLPEKGISRNEILNFLKELEKKETPRWKKGYVSGAVYHGDQEFIKFLNEAFSIHSQTNPLHFDLWGSIVKFENEIISMCAELVNGPEGICGSVTNGGTESILLAVKTYRDWAKKELKIKNPEMIVPSTAHPAFDKASHYFNVKIKKITVDENYSANIKKTIKSITRNTILIVGSAPSFPYGVIDPLAELSEIAYQKGIGLHTDACLGGFILPFAKKLGFSIPDFDFSLRGVTSLSMDTHKYGFALKGTSVILYRNEALRKYQFFSCSDWPGGLYFSPTFAGSRNGGIIAATYASLLHLGKKGYLQATEKILKTAREIKKGIEDIPELYILGNPLWIIAFSSKNINIYQVLEQMSKKGWNLNGLQRPPAIHIAVTLRHIQKGVSKKFISDLKKSVEEVKQNPQKQTGLAPIYGVANSLPLRTMVDDFLKEYLNILYKMK